MFASHKHYVCKSKTLCLQVKNTMFTSHKHYVYESQSACLKYTNIKNKFFSFIVASESNYI